MSSGVGYGIPYAIDGPLPLPPVYGLLPAAEAPAAGVRFIPDGEGEAGTERWLNGVQVYGFPPDLPEVHNPCAVGSDQNIKGLGAFASGVADNPEFAAMTVWIAETCKSYRVWDQQRFIARAQASFAARESYGVANEFMNGTSNPLSRHLNDAVDTEFPNGDSVTGAKLSLWYLEREIARTGSFGLIHMTPSFATVLREFLAIDNKTGVLRTVNGTVVIADDGYTDSVAPHGHAAAAGRQEWIYATGPIDIRHSKAFVLPGNVSEALDRGMAATLDQPNTITYRVERYYLVDWDTQLHAAVLADPFA